MPKLTVSGAVPAADTNFRPTAPEQIGSFLLLATYPGVHTVSGNFRILAEQGLSEQHLAKACDRVEGRAEDPTKEEFLETRRLKVPLGAPRAFLSPSR